MSADPAAGGEAPTPTDEARVAIAKEFRDMAHRFTDELRDGEWEELDPMVQSLYLAAADRCIAALRPRQAETATPATEALAALMNAIRSETENLAPRVHSVAVNMALARADEALAALRVSPPAASVPSGEPTDMALLGSTPEEAAAYDRIYSAIGDCDAVALDRYLAEYRAAALRGAAPAGAGDAPASEPTAATTVTGAMSVGGPVSGTSALLGSRSCGLAGCGGRCGICTPPPEAPALAALERLRDGWRMPEDFETIAAALRSPSAPPPEEPGAPDDGSQEALEILCRVFDDGADAAYPEWLAWYKPAEWLDWSRALGAFINGRLVACLVRAASPTAGATDAQPVKWLLSPRGTEGHQRVYVEEREQRDGAVLYAVTLRGWVLSRDGDWEYEPQPSSRDDDFVARTRFTSFAEAVAAERRARSALASPAGSPTPTTDAPAQQEET